MSNIRKRWWFLARLSFAMGILVCVCYGTGFVNKQGAGFLMLLCLIVFAWAYACTFAQLRIDYEKRTRSRRK